MKVKEDIVYDKVSGQITGFCNLGDINDELLKCEREAESEHPPVANHSSHNGSWGVLQV